MATYIYNCKGCKTGKRVEYDRGTAKFGYSRLDVEGKPVLAGIWVMACGGGRPTVYGGDLENGLCKECGRAMTYGVLQGRFNPEHKCDARCLASRGPNCECSCGGANHGKGWTA